VSLRAAGLSCAPYGSRARYGLQTLHAEWTKLRTVASTGWLLLGAAVLTVAVSTAADAAATCPSSGCQADTAKLSLTGVQAGQAIVAIIAVLAVSNEYSTGMIRITLTAMPRRLTVLAAKAALITGLVLAAAAVAVLASVLAGRLILPGHGFTAAHGYPLPPASPAPLSLSSGPVLRAACGSVLYLALIALFTLGVATAVRETAVATGLVLGLLYVFPVVTSVIGNQHWQRHLEQIGPMTAGLDIQATVDLRSLPLTPWEGLGVLALWAAGALIVGALIFRLRDA
jgi:ABC-2 type transport system permease protein